MPVAHGGPVAYGCGMPDRQPFDPIAEAFRQGNLGITDYYHLKNIQSDTEMRSAIAGSGNYRREPAGG